MQTLQTTKGNDYIVNDAGEIVAKQCTKCKETKDINAFYNSKNGFKGKKCQCKQCTDAVSHKWRQDNKELIKAYSKYYRIKHIKGD